MGFPPKTQPAAHPPSTKVMLGTHRGEHGPPQGWISSWNLGLLEQTSFRVLEIGKFYVHVRPLMRMSKSCQSQITLKWREDARCKKNWSRKFLNISTWHSDTDVQNCSMLGTVLERYPIWWSKTDKTSLSPSAGCHPIGSRCFSRLNHSVVLCGNTSGIWV